MKIDKNIIKQLRLKQGFTQEQLAHYCGCNQRTIMRVEKDGTCSQETLNALAAVFGVKTWVLIGKKSIQRFPQNVNGEEQYLIRLYSGKMIIETFINSIAYKIDYEIPKNTNDAEFVANAIQEIKDWGELWSDFDIGEQIKASTRLTELISEIEEKGFVLFGLRTKERLNIFSQEIEGSICNLFICYQDNDNIVILNSENLDHKMCF
ncbi:helix-turn-helix domain-containing protein [Legionella hackeliae]|uniref:Transposase n=1 Tax=Legionella hackeliae TaxID=449 RepID=A0A0A8URM9_LEGHA|nr:helix-turn-helix domain-containing protein [Legionella hackeliae]KTD14074.1 transposase [Legionella hackeliae]CEK10131.1 transposase [Legionella hackeliae]STX46856.1 ISI400 transposase B [Legionella hackeliae]